MWLLLRRLLWWLLLWRLSWWLLLATHAALGRLARRHPLLGRLLAAGGRRLLWRLAARPLLWRLGLRRLSATLVVLAGPSGLFALLVRASGVDVLVHGFTCRYRSSRGDQRPTPR